MSLVFTVVLFAIAKTWKQPKGPFTDDWIRKMWYKYTVEYYSAIQKTKYCPILLLSTPRHHCALLSFHQDLKDTEFLFFTLFNTLKFFVK